MLTDLIIGRAMMAPHARRNHAAKAHGFFWHIARMARHFAQRA